MSLQRVLAKRLERRKKRVRGKIKGTSERPRLTVSRSNSHIYAQIIDDVSGKTLVSASDVDKDIKAGLAGDMDKSAKAAAVGKALAERASQANVKGVVFDRNGLLYHGRIKSLAEAAREAGLKF